MNTYVGRLLSLVLMPQLGNSLIQRQTAARPWTFKNTFNYLGKASHKWWHRKRVGTRIEIENWSWIGIENKKKAYFFCYWKWFKDINMLRASHSTKSLLFRHVKGLPMAMKFSSGPDAKSQRRPSSNNLEFKHRLGRYLLSSDNFMMWLHICTMATRQDRKNVRWKWKGAEENLARHD